MGMLVRQASVATSESPELHASRFCHHHGQQLVRMSMTRSYSPRRIDSRCANVVFRWRRLLRILLRHKMRQAGNQDYSPHPKVPQEEIAEISKEQEDKKKTRQRRRRRGSILSARTALL
eukprot:2306317-Amphidinium_carterae.1